MTAWRTDRLAELVGEEARESARRIVADAEREAGALRAAARDEARDAAAALAAVEQLGVELSGTVRAFRLGEAPAAAPRPAAIVPPEAAPVPARTPARARPRRASLKDSSLADMMRASSAR